MARDLGGIYTAIEADVTGLKEAVRATKKLAATADKQFKKVSGTARKEFAIVARAAEKAARASERDYKESARVAIASAKASARGSIAAAKATEKAAKAAARVKIVAAKKAEKAIAMAAKKASMASIKAVRLEAQETKAAYRAKAAAAKKAARVSAQAAAKVERANKRWRIGLLAVGFAMGLVIKRSIKMADTFNILQQRIKAATLATGDYAEVSRELSDIADRTGTELLGNVALFQTLARTAPELNSTNKEMLKLTELLGQLGVIGGSNIMQMRNGLLQFSQAMAGGIFRAEEMNGIIENIPEVAARMAKGLGVTVGKMRLLTLEGNLSAKAGFESLMGQIEEVNIEFGKMPEVIARSTVKMKNSIEQFLGRMDKVKGLTTSIAEGITGLATMLNKADVNAFANGLERVAIYLAAIAAVRMGVAIASLWALTAAVTATGKILKLSGWPALVLLLAEAAIFVKNSKEIAAGIDSLGLDGAKQRLKNLEGQKKMEPINGLVYNTATVMDDDGQLDKAIKKQKALILAIEGVIEVGKEAEKAAQDAQIAETARRLALDGAHFFDPGVRLQKAKEQNKQLQNEADNAEADRVEAAQKAAASERKSLESSIQSLATSLMTERELITHTYKEKQKIVDAAEKAGLAALIPYSEQRIRLQQQEWDAIKAIKDKENRWLVDGLKDINKSFMTEKQLRAKALKDKETVLTGAYKKGYISEKAAGYKIGLLRDQFRQENIDKAAQTATEVAEAAEAAWEATGVPALRERYASEKTIAENAHIERLAGLKDALEMDRITQAEHDALEIKSKQEKVDALAAIDESHLKGYSTLKTLFGAVGIRLSKKNATEEEKANEKAFTKQLSMAEGHSRSLFNAQKNLQIAQAVIDGHSAVLSSYRHGAATGGPLLAAVYAGLALASTATQIAAISSASYGGGRLHGGSVSPNTAYSVNENKRPELLTVGGKDMLMMGSQGGKVTPNNRLGGGNTVVNVKVVPATEGQTAEVSQQQTSEGVDIMVRLVDKVDQELASRASTGESDFGNVMESLYGLNSANGSFG